MCCGGQRPWNNGLSLGMSVHFPYTRIGAGLVHYGDLYLFSHSSVIPKFNPNESLIGKVVLFQLQTFKVMKDVDARVCIFADTALG